METFSLRFLAPQLWLGFLLLVPAVSLALWTYHGLLAPLSVPARSTLWALRGLAFALLIFVLWQPVASIGWRDDGKPALAVLIDRSLSMRLPDGGKGGRDRSDVVKDVIPRLRSALGDRYRVQWYGFNQELRSVRPDSLPAGEGSTAMGGAVEGVAGRLSEPGLGGIVLVSDGVNTQGVDPVEAAANSPVPLFTVAVGPDRSPADLEIRRIDTNRTAFAGEVLPIRVSLASIGLEGRRVRVEVREEGNLRDTREIQLGVGAGLEQEVAFSLEATRPGLTTFEVRADVEGDSIAQNNARLVAVRVLERKTRVLCLADAVSWDYGFLRRTLEADTSLSYSFCVQDRPGHFRVDDRDSMRRVPSSLGELQDFAAIVVVLSGTEGLPPTMLDMVGAFARRGGGLLLLGGPGPNQQLTTALADALPASPGGGRRADAPVSLLLTSAGMRHPASALRDNPADAAQWVASLPPLWPEARALAPKPGAETLLEFAGDRSRSPALVTWSPGQGRAAWWAARGLWRWRLAAAGAGLGGDALAEMCVGLVHWLSEPVSRERFQVEPTKTVYQNGEVVAWSGSIWTAAYEPLADASIQVAVRSVADSGLSRTERVQLAAAGEPGRYEGRGHSLPPGAYTYEADARGPAGEALGRSTGKFWVESMGAEFQRPWSDRQTLAEMARRSGGSAFELSTLGDLASAIPRVLRRVGRTTDVELWNHPVLFALFVLLLATEWYLRRRRGLA